ncbi:MAG: DUF523 and DUF1722 domain-containing protein [Nitrospinales bacterium]|nr:DUF523 and DUF1722 domain-containing protein [Nitrospinales bacterium]
MKEKIKIGMSSCLLGEEVRWDGDHKHDQYVRDVLGSYFDYVSICPEVDVGMGVPRETVALYGTLENPKMITKRSKTDWTKKMNHYTKDRIHELTKENLCGYVFKSKSPSCGIGKVPIYSEFGSSRMRHGSGMFASSFVKVFPLVPVEDEGRLHDPVIRENFIVRIFCFHRLQLLVRKSFSIGSLVRFHTRHKFLILSHSRKKYDDMGELVANAKKIKTAELKTRYSKLFMAALTYKSTPKKNTDVLLHMVGFLKKILTREGKKDILSVIEDYRNELLPLVVPVTLIYHQVKKHNIEYLLDQVYLNPHPKELMLRNHV